MIRRRRSRKSTRGDPMINTIIDTYHGNSSDLEQAMDGGIVAIIHKATQGLSFRDSKYHARRDAAKALWVSVGGLSFLDRRFCDRSGGELPDLRPTGRRRA